MTTQPIIPYSTLSVRELTDIYNELAAPRGVPLLTNWRGRTHSEMVQRVALLKTEKLLVKPKPVKVPRHGSYAAGGRKIPAKTLVIVEELCRVSHWESPGGIITDEARAKALGKEARSVGFTYAAILLAIRDRDPDSTLTGGTLRGYATRVRRSSGAYGNFALPDRRPRDNTTEGKLNYDRKQADIARAIAAGHGKGVRDGEGDNRRA